MKRTIIFLGFTLLLFFMGVSAVRAMLYDGIPIDGKHAPVSQNGLGSPEAEKPTRTRTYTPSLTPTFTFTPSETPTPTETNTQTETPTYTPTEIITDTIISRPKTHTPTLTKTPTPTKTLQPPITVTSTVTPSPLRTSTPTQTRTPTKGPSETPSHVSAKLFLPSVLRSFPPIFKDDFSSDLGWTLISEPNGNALPQNGKYLIYHYDQNKAVFCIAPIPLPLTPKFMIEVDAKRDLGNDMRYGIIFGWVNQDQFYLFIIDPASQNYFIYLYDNGYQILGDGYSKFINPDNQSNLLAVEKIDSSIQILVNNHPLLNSPIIGTPTEPNHKVGLIITSGSDVPSLAEFDDFIVRGLP